MHTAGALLAECHGGDLRHEVGRQAVEVALGHLEVVVLVLCHPPRFVRLGWRLLGGLLLLSGRLLRRLFGAFLRRLEVGVVLVVRRVALLALLRALALAGLALGRPRSGAVVVVVVA